MKAHTTPERASGPACPACGAPYALGTRCPAGCPAASGCAMACCTACGETFPHPSRSPIAYRLSRWLHGRRPTIPGAPS